MRRLLALVLCWAALGCAPLADARLTRQFALPVDVATTDTAAVRRAILHAFPPGTPEAVVRARLTARGIGRDGESHYYGPDSTGEVVVRIESTRRHWAVVRPHFGIIFQYDRARNLHDLEVRRWLTGP